MSLKPWQIIAGFCASLVIIGLLLCDDIGAHNNLRDCQRAVGLKPDTVVHVTIPPKDSQIPQGVGIHPAHKPDTPRLSGLNPADTIPPGRDTSKQAIPGKPGTAGRDSGEFEPFCIEDTTVFPDSEKIYHRVCSPDLKSTSRITDLWTFRELPPDTQKTISKPIIYTRTPLWAHWYIEVPAGILLTWTGYKIGVSAKK